MKDGERQNYTRGKYQTLINRLALSVYLVFSRSWNGPNPSFSTASSTV